MKLVVLLLAGACTVATAHVDVEDLCVTYPNVKISGVSPGTTMIDRTFTFDHLDAIESLTSSLRDLELLRLDARATSGVADLGFIAAAHVTVASGNPASPLPTLDAYDCDGDCAASGSLTVPSTLQQSALAYVESGSVRVDLDLAGTFPADDWAIDVDVCFRGTLDYNATL